MIRTRVYDLLCDHFVQRYGTGARCTDLLGFLKSFQARPDVATLMASAMAEDLRAMERTWDPAALATTAVGTMPPAATVFFQVAAHSHEAVLKGEHLLIVNQYNPGHGGLLARFLPLLGSAPELRDGLRGWLSQMNPEASLATLSVGADWNSLQGRGSDLFPRLDWLTECPGTDQGTRFQDLILQHDPRTATLSLQTPAGEPFAPVYLGVIPHYLFSGLLRLFFTLIDPWVNGHRVGWILRPYAKPPSPPARVEHFPRKTHGRIVMRRARWRVPTDQFPLQGPDEEDAAYLMRVDRWRSSHGVPTECFVTLEWAQPMLDASRRKPVWLHFGSLHALSVVRQMLEETVSTICLTEALPNREQHWLPGQDGLPRAAEFLALLRWPRT